MDSMLNHWKVPGFKLQLASAAPRLLSLRDCLLTVPGMSTARSRFLFAELIGLLGQYDHHIKLDNQAFIDSFHPTVDIVSSKQLPRKLVIRSYNSDFTFLLKGESRYPTPRNLLTGRHTGNEDLRGDERIMQLFTLINTLLNHESEAFGRNLHLLPYQVIPLSPSAGLLSWVKNTQP
jgi:FKBP12-rapamycin complex-associated protein